MPVRPICLRHKTRGQWQIQGMTQAIAVIPVCSYARPSRRVEFMVETDHVTCQVQILDMDVAMKNIENAFSKLGIPWAQSTPLDATNLPSDSLPPLC